MTHGEAEALLGFRISPGWTFHEIHRGGELAAFVMQQGREVHAWRSPKFAGRWGTRGDIERLLGPILAQHGEVLTKVRADNQAAHRFVSRLGFERTAEIDGVAHYRAVRCNHARL